MQVMNTVCTNKKAAAGNDTTNKNQWQLLTIKYENERSSDLRSKWGELLAVGGVHIVAVEGGQLLDEVGQAQVEWAAQGGGHHLQQHFCWIEVM